MRVRIRGFGWLSDLWWMYGEFITGIGSLVLLLGMATLLVWGGFALALPAITGAPTHFGLDAAFGVVMIFLAAAIAIRLIGHSSKHE